MSPISVVNKAPGVYIEEVQLPGAIAGVGTSTAAFIGPALQGPINRPTFLTNLTQFENTFGSYITAPMVYVTHAVRGFFENGGASCYFVRVGTAARSSLPLDDRGTGAPTLVVTARQEGSAGDAITVAVQDASIVASIKAVQEQVNLTAAAKKDQNQVTVAAGDAAKFRPGDAVLLEEGANSDQATITKISGTTITLDKNLANDYTNAGKLRTADLAAGQANPRIRLADTTGIEPGSYVTITDGTNTDSGVVKSVERQNNAITLESGLAKTYGMEPADPDVTLKTEEFTLIVTPKAPAAVENYANLSMDPRHSSYFAAVVNSPTVEVTLADPPSPELPPKNRPAVTTSPQKLAGGANDEISKIAAPNYQQGINALERVDDVNILCIPDRTDQDVQAAMIAHCEKMQDRFAVLDPQPNASPSNGIVMQRNLLGSDRGFAAIYYPWIMIANPLAAGRIKVPPSGHIAGVYARTDDQRGVHKAPANTAIRGALGLERTLSDDEQGPLNEQGVNVIRSFPGRGVIVWGARTISQSTQWRYVNVRRLLLFIEESIQEGTQFAVFEPNDLALWERVKRQVTDFLTRVWRNGALFGATAEEAFRVRVDEELNPPSVRALGQLVVEIVLFPTTPAEFIVFRIIQQPGGPVVEE